MYQHPPFLNEGLSQGTSTTKVHKNNTLLFYETCKKERKDI